MSKNQSQQVDVDGDGKADFVVSPVTDSAFEQAAAQADAKRRAASQPKSNKNAKPTAVDGGDAPRSDVLDEFQQQKAEPHFRIVIPSTGVPGEVKRVPAGLNGVIYTIERDREVVVPAGVLRVLDDAVETRYRDGPKDSMGNTTKEAYEVKSYHYQVMGEVEPTAIQK